MLTRLRTIARRAAEALFWAVVAWLIVFGAVGAFTSANKEMAIDLASIFSLLVFVGYFVFDPEWSVPAGS